MGQITLTLHQIHPLLSNISINLHPGVCSPLTPSLELCEHLGSVSWLCAKCRWLGSVRTPLSGLPQEWGRGPAHCGEHVGLWQSPAPALPELGLRPGHGGRMVGEVGWREPPAPGYCLPWAEPGASRPCKTGEPADPLAQTKARRGTQGQEVWERGQGLHGTEAQGLAIRRRGFWPWHSCAIAV